MLKNEFTTKLNDFDTFTKIAYQCGRFGQINFAKGFKNLPKVQLIANSGHTGHRPNILDTKNLAAEIQFQMISRAV